MVSSLVRWYSDSFRERNWSIPSRTACTVYAVYELILSVKLRGEISYWRRIVSVSLTLSLSLSFFSILFKDFSFSISIRSQKDIRFTKSPVCNRDATVYTLTIDITQKPTNKWGKTKKTLKGKPFGEHNKIRKITFVLTEKLKQNDKQNWTNINISSSSIYPSSGNWWDISLGNKIPYIFTNIFFIFVVLDVRFALLEFFPLSRIYPAWILCSKLL